VGTEQSGRLVIPQDNRPAPLSVTSVPMWADRTCQMSFGERAALEGVLSQRKPRLAVEIGTYEGGSLHFLAAHCEHVHTIDLYDLVEDRAPYGNVSFHTGDSKLLLPELLQELEAAGLAVDLALVDGDHSAQGVRSDLESLLSSATTASTLILLHDTMNMETREGIESVGLSTHPKVVYHELDFVPGYEFAGGNFEGQVWGGLGLVVTGESRLTGYTQASGQTRYRRPFDMLHEERRMRSELALVRREAESNQTVLAAVQSSLSWRLTAPLRWAKRALLARRTPSHD
jgi:cephalosporin hydroxylase